MLLTDYFRFPKDATWDIARQSGVEHGVIRLPETNVTMLFIVVTAPTPRMARHSSTVTIRCKYLIFTFMPSSCNFILVRI